MHREVAILLILLSACAPDSQAPPNIVYLMADDLGIGDVKCYGGDRCQIATPAFDSLARDGMLFTDAHATASVSENMTSGNLGMLRISGWRCRLGMLTSSRATGLDATRIQIPMRLEHGSGPHPPRGAESGSTPPAAGERVG